MNLSRERVFKMKISKQEFSTQRGLIFYYYCLLRVTDYENSSAWLYLDKHIAESLKISLEEYQSKANYFGAIPLQSPCQRTHFRTLNDAQQFIDEYLDPVVLSFILQSS